MFYNGLSIVLVNQNHFKYWASYLINNLNKKKNYVVKSLPT